MKCLICNEEMEVEDKCIVALNERLSKALDQFVVGEWRTILLCSKYELWQILKGKK